MITEKRLKDFVAVLGDASFQELLSTCEKLWKVARAAKDWTKAYPGSAAVDAEAVLVKELEGLRWDA